MKQAGEIWLPSGDNFFVNEQEYELHEFSVAMQHVSEFRNAIDIGAHVGFWSRRLCSKFLKVTSFEPVPDHFECLVKNTERYHNIERHSIALSNTAGNVYINQHIENSGMSCITDSTTGLPVKTNTLDSYNLENVDIIKIDVEGYEPEVLQGAERTITTYNPILFIEVLGQYKQTSPVFDVLARYGYTQVEELADNYIFKNVK